MAFGAAESVMPVLSDAQIATAAANAGFPANEIGTAVAVALAESGGRTDAVNYNHDQWNSRDLGTWQINDHYHSDLLAGGTWSNPQDNARMALSVWKGGGWSRWTTYTSGAYFVYLVRGRAAAKNVGKVSLPGGGPNYGAGWHYTPPRGYKNWSVPLTLPQRSAAYRAVTRAYGITDFAGLAGAGSWILDHNVGSSVTGTAGNLNLTPSYVEALQNGTPQTAYKAAFLSGEIDAGIISVVGVLVQGPQVSGGAQHGVSSTNAIGQILDAVKGIVHVFAAISDPHNLLRVAMFVMGLLVGVLALRRMATE
jgi:hypothetical protein